MLKISNINNFVEFSIIKSSICGYIYRKLICHLLNTMGTYVRPIAISCTYLSLVAHGDLNKNHGIACRCWRESKKKKLKFFLRFSPNIFTIFFHFII